MDEHYAAEYVRLEREHWWWRARRGFVFDLLSSGLERGDRRPRLLEIGTGAGANVELAANDYDCVGIEPDPFLREEAARRSGCPIEAGSLPGPLRFDSGAFDVCLLLDVIEHIEDDVGAVREALRLVAPDGVVVINVPAMPSLWSVHDEVNQHFRRYTSAALLGTLRSAGCRVLSWRYWGTALVPLLWVERRLKRRSQSRDDYRVGIPSAPVGAVLGATTKIDYRLNPLRRWAGTSLLAMVAPER